MDLQLIQQILVSLKYPEKQINLLIDFFYSTINPVIASTSQKKWPYYMTDNHLNYELSVCFRERGSQLRLAFEPDLGEMEGEFPCAQRQKAIELLRTKIPWGDKVVDLLNTFFPNPAAPFDCFFGVDLPHDGPVKWKLYVNPRSSTKEFMALPSVVQDGITLGYKIDLIAFDIEEDLNKRVKLYARTWGLVSTLKQYMGSVYLKDYETAERFLSYFCDQNAFSNNVYSAAPLLKFNIENTVLSYTRLDLPLHHLFSSDSTIFDKLHQYIEKNVGEKAAFSYGQIVNLLDKDLSTTDVTLHHYISGQFENNCCSEITVYLISEKK